MSAWEEGDASRKICLLGEAPGKTEVRLGRPLIGPSGEVLSECLHVAGLARGQTYMINTWPFQVHKDKGQNIFQDTTKLWDSKKGMTQAGWDLSAPTLEKISQSGANVVVPMGRPALNLLMGENKPIMKWRGSPLWSKVTGKKVLPTIHPAAVMWSGIYIWRYLIISDLEKASKEMESPELVLPKRNLLIRPTFADVYHFMHSCREAGRFATDLEVMNRHVSCFSMAVAPNEALTIPLVGPQGGPYWDEAEEEAIWKHYASLMSDPSIMKINHNIVGFDSPFLLMQCNIHTAGPVGDTMIAQSIMYPEFPMGLDFVASVHTREPYWKDDGKIWKKVSFDWDVFQRYCGTDAAVAIEAWGVLEKEMTEGGYWQTYNMTVDMRDPLAYMSTDGLAVDKSGLAETNIRLDGLIQESEARLHEACGRELNVNSSKQCQEYFYEHLGLQAYRNREGGITCDDKAMSRIVRRASLGSKEARIVQEVRRYRKLKSTYMEVELDEDSRLRCSWNPRGTWTGRLSSSQTIFGTGLNLQNLDPDFKAFVVAG